MTEWNKELEKKILKKSKFTLTLRILRILAAVFLIYVIYMFGLHFVQDKLNVVNKNQYYSSLVLEWTVPNVQADHFTNDEITTIFGTNKFSFNLMKAVGGEYKVIGEANITKRLLNAFSEISYSTPGFEEYRNFRFTLPEDPRNSQKVDIEKSPNVWETLDKLPEGTVGELAFSTTEFMTPDELMKKLSKYDISVLWMPLYTGEFKNYKPTGWGQEGANGLQIFDLIGLTGGMDHRDNYTFSMRSLNLTESSIDDSERLMLKNMKDLLKESESYHEFLGINNLDKKYEYLKDGGFTVYGAVITGPVKELLKLKNEPFLHKEQLGEVELWNWN